MNAIRYKAGEEIENGVKRKEGLMKLSAYPQFSM